MTCSPSSGSWNSAEAKARRKRSGKRTGSFPSGAFADRTRRDSQPVSSTMAIEPRCFLGSLASLLSLVAGLLLG